MSYTDSLSLDSSSAPAPAVAKYDPASRAARQDLAAKMIAMLENAGFTLLPRGRKGGELVYMRPHASDDRMQIRVYTSIIDHSTRKVGWSFSSTPLSAPEVRKSGKDAIRVALVWETSEGKTRGVAKDTRVNRNGSSTAFEITDRVLQRMRGQYAKVSEVARCSCCGAPKFTSKVRKDASGKVIGGGNLVCAELCFKNPAARAAYRAANPAAAPAPAAPKAPKKSVAGDYSAFEAVEVPEWL